MAADKKKLKSYISSNRKAKGKMFADGGEVPEENSPVPKGFEDLSEQEQNAIIDRNNRTLWAGVGSASPNPEAGEAAKKLMETGRGLPGVSAPAGPTTNKAPAPQQTELSRRSFASPSEQEPSAEVDTSLETAAMMAIPLAAPAARAIGRGAEALATPVARAIGQGLEGVAATAGRVAGNDIGALGPREAELLSEAQARVGHKITGGAPADSLEAATKTFDDATRVVAKGGLSQEHLDAIANHVADTRAAMTPKAAEVAWPSRETLNHLTNVQQKTGVPLTFENGLPPNSINDSFKLLNAAKQSLAKGKISPEEFKATQEYALATQEMFRRKLGGQFSPASLADPYPNRLVGGTKGELSAPSVPNSPSPAATPTSMTNDALARYNLRVKEGYAKHAPPEGSKIFKSKKFADGGPIEGVTAPAGNPTSDTPPPFEGPVDKANAEWKQAMDAAHQGDYSQLGNIGIRNGLSAFGSVEAPPESVLSHPEAKAVDFHAAVNDAMQKSPKVKESLLAYSPEEYANMSTYLSPDKNSGYAIKPSGELASVFSIQPGRGKAIVQDAIANGATKLRAYDNGFLPDFYKNLGFSETSREPNPMGDGPDIVSMRYPKTLVHYSNKQLKEIDPKYMGSGFEGAEAARGADRMPVMQYYEENTTPETLVADQAKYVHEVKNPGKILDLASSEAIPFREQATDFQNLLENVKAAGYNGFKNSDHPNIPNVVNLFDKQKVSSVQRNYPSSSLDSQGFYSGMERVLQDKMPESATPTQVKGILKNAKVEEAEYSGVNDYLDNSKGFVSKQGLLNHIKENTPQIKEVQLGGGDPVGGPSKYDQYTLPGGTNYREVLMTLPNKENPSTEPFTGKFQSSHFDEPNVLAHYRLADHVTPDGKKTLLVEEIQSDWHQKGRDEGYQQRDNSAQIDSLKNQVNTIYDDGSKSTDQRLSEAGLLQAQIRELYRQGAHGVPDAPFKKTWHELALKRILSQAAHEGYDSVSIVPGAEQADRYQLSKQISEVQYSTGNNSFKAFDHEGNPVIARTGVGEKDLADLIGKETAKKLLDQKPVGTLRSLEGQDLNIGGEGMKTFYDKMLPQAAEKLVKKWGGEVKEGKISSEVTSPKTQGVPKKIETKVHTIELTPTIRNAIKREGFPKFAKGGRVKSYAEGGGVSNDSEQTPQVTNGPVGNVNVMSPDGTIGSLPQEQVQDALQAGYSIPSPEQLDQHFKEQEYGTTGQQIKTGFEGLAEGLLGPAAPALETNLGIATPEAIRSRQEVNPLAHAFPEAIGLVGGMMAGVGEGAVLNEAGQAARGLMAAGKPTFISQVGPEAVKSAFEAALYQGGQELSAKFKQDPNQTAASALMDIGLVGVIGGVFGGPIGAAIGKGAVETTPAFVSQLDMPGLESGALKESITHSDNLKPSFKNKVLEAIDAFAAGESEKHNADEIRAAAARIGADPLEGMVSDNTHIQKAEDALINGAPTYSGLRRAAKYEANYDKVLGAVNEAVGSDSPYSKAELGDILKSSLSGKLKDENAPISEMYTQLRQNGLVPVNEDEIASLIEDLSKIPEFKVTPNSPQGALIGRVVNNLENVNSIEDLKVLKDSIYGSLPKTASTGEYRAAAILKDKLNQLEESQIMSAAKKANTPEMFANWAQTKAAADSAYRPFIEKVGTLLDKLGKGKIHGAQDALNFIQDLTPEAIADKLFSKKDSSFLKFFQGEFPEEMELIKAYQKGELAARATVQDKLSPQKVISSVFGSGAKKGLEPEIQKVLFNPEELQKLKDAQTVLNSFPKNFNPSGTAGMSAFREFFSHPTGAIVANARDFAIEKYIKNVSNSPKIQEAINLAKATVQGDKLASKSVKALFDTSAKIPTAALPAITQRAKLSKLVEFYSTDPTRLTQDSSKSRTMPEYNQAFAQSSMRAINYLNSVKPRSEPQNPLDSKIPVASYQKAAYDRALDIAQQPLAILDRMKSGTMTAQDVSTLKSVHPEVYLDLSQRITHAIAEQTDKGMSIPYSMRLQLSSFLGQPLDSTMTPQAILSAQGVQSQPEQQAQGLAPTKKGTSKLGGIAKQAETATQHRQAARSGQAKD